MNIIQMKVVESAELLYTYMQVDNSRNEKHWKCTFWIRS